MDAQVASAIALVLPVLAALAALAAAVAAMKAAKLTKAAAIESERVSASLIQLHRETERLHAAWRSGGGAAAAPPAAPAARPQPSSPDAPAPAQEAASGEETMMAVRLTVPVQVKDQFHGLAMLRVKTGPDQGREVTLPFDRSTIGRGNTNRVVLTEEKASRVHAEVYYDGTRFMLRDVGSTNGTVMGGAPVNGEVPLEFGNTLSIGRTDLLFTCEGHDLKETEPGRAIGAFERLLEREGSCVGALQTLAFLLERDVARRSEADAVWKRLKRLES